MINFLYDRATGSPNKGGGTFDSSRAFHGTYSEDKDVMVHNSVISFVKLVLSFIVDFSKCWQENFNSRDNTEVEEKKVKNDARNAYKNTFVCSCS